MKNKVIKNIVVLIISTLIYFLATYPLRHIFTVFSVTDVRPGAALNPLLSMCLGPFGTLGVAVATTLGDYLSGYPSMILYQGFVLQFVYGYLSYQIWIHLTKGDEHRYRLDSLAKILKFVCVALVFGATSSLGVAYFVYSNFGANFFETLGFVFMNNFDFTMIIGMPVLIISNIVVNGISKKTFRRPSLNELLILFNVLVDVVVLSLIIYFAYRQLAGITDDIYTIWNTIYFRGAIAINVIIALTGVIIYLIDKEKNKGR